MQYDFAGYVTKNDLVCADGLVIRKDAFKDCDGKTVPLVWQHLRDDPTNVIGHALLENRSDGVYGYCLFNDTEKGRVSKSLVNHGDIKEMSIHANRVRRNGRDVTHGMIKEVSLVIAGANPGAYIENLSVSHGLDDFEDIDDEIILHTGDTVALYQEDIDESQNGSEDDMNDNKIEHAEENGDKTIQEVFDSMTEEQKNVVYAMVGAALSGGEEVDDEETEQSDDLEGDDTLKHSVFDRGNSEQNDVLTHEEQTAILESAKRIGSLREAVKDYNFDHGITNLEILFPEAKAVSPTPTMIDRNQDWVSKVWNGTRKLPFSRIKSVTADLTPDDARARGYIKGKKKLEEQFALLKRVTTPQTVYKKQKLDRDDLIDIVDFDVVAWMKVEMRNKLNEELARAVLVGDGRLASSDDKINPLNIRPIAYDDALYTIKAEVDPSYIETEDGFAEAVIRASTMARIDYKGSGSPVMYIAPTALAIMLMCRDKIGRRLYNTVNDLAVAFRVREIIEVPILDEISGIRDLGIGFEAAGLNTPSVASLRAASSDSEVAPFAIIVNLQDYAIGADRGGAVSMFDDFDIDYNQMKYLIETRCSGALVQPYSAIALAMGEKEEITPPKEEITPPSEN